MWRSVRAIGALFSLFLSSCDQLQGVEPLGCTSELGHEAAVAALTDKLEREVGDFYGGEVAKVASKSKVRAFLTDMKFEILDVRTEKEDPNSTKRFCIGYLKVTYSVDAIADAEKANEVLGTDDVTTRAEIFDFQRNANTFTMPIDFNVQPTDDGKKVYAEIENSDNILSFNAEMIADALMRRTVDANKIRQEQEEAQAQAEAKRAQEEQRQASLNESKATMALSVQAINATWQTLDQDIRDQFLPIQRAWVKRKSADCKMEAAEASLDPTEREVARMKCETRMNNFRREELQSLGYESAY